MYRQVIPEITDFRRLDWSKVRHSSGTAGSFLKSREIIRGVKWYYKLSDYDAIIFGGWFMAGGIKNLAWFKNQIPELSAAGKKIIVYGVGGSPADSPEIPAAMRRNFTDEEWNSLKAFYCPGGFNYEKMSGFSKFMMKMFTTMLANKKDASEAEKNMAQMISHSYDISDKKYIEPILAELK